MSSKSLPSRAARLGAIVLATWALLFGFWMLLVDIPSLPEVLLGIGATAIATAGSELVRRQRIAQVRVEPRWLPRLWRPFARVPLDTGIVTWALVRQLAGRRKERGRFRAMRFRAAGGDPASTGRRALAESFGSLAPNTFVVGVDPDRELIIVHQLVPSDDPAGAMDPLGLR
jgi:multisubunit Na+/H+ antiporter MnhE subunit